MSTDIVCKSLFDELIKALTNRTYLFNSANIKQPVKLAYSKQHCRLETVSASLPQQNISNYDTIENILDNGESVYHHTTFHKSPQITPRFDVGESIYDR
jgi:hypothetical protein